MAQKEMFEVGDMLLEELPEEVAAILTNFDEDHPPTEEEMNRVYDIVAKYTISKSQPIDQGKVSIDGYDREAPEGNQNMSDSDEQI